MIKPLRLLTRLNIWLGVIATGLFVPGLILDQHYWAAGIFFAVCVSWLYLGAWARNCLNMLLEDKSNMESHIDRLIKEVTTANRELIEANREVTKHKWLLDIACGSTQEDLDAVADHKFYDPAIPSHIKEGFSPITDPDYFTEDAYKWARWVEGRNGCRVTEIMTGIYHCTREHDHDGPCAAWETNAISKNHLLRKV